MTNLKPLSALIIDDEKPARQRLQRLIAPLELLHLTDQAENAEVAMEKISESQPDLVFLDISMPAMNGIELAQWITKEYPTIKIIFTTAYDEYALDAFEVNATDYLLKPIRRERLLRAVKKLFPAEQQAEHYILKDGNITHKILLNDIIFLHADQKYTEVHLSDKTLLSSDSLKDFEERYPEQLLRIHRSTLINPDLLLGIEQQGSSMLVNLKNTETKPEVSRRHQAQVRKFLKG